ncbi:oxidoreductase FAD-binding protein [Westerdykella ornata]|uniref:Oxidoreductase FAD-binding protein n=1 Tax=Westerdykella ornata TaxID=318751 RepID=A0A6A6JNC0_WESOR|nr:oxidoreductase FAD-binding protein [Westerdykella ornata]KAF2278012.1 oxidoreductase FAD-binding protein [Westerdykella ornata]
MLTLLILLCALVRGILGSFPDPKSILEQLRRTGACCTALDYFLPGKVHFNNIGDTEYHASQKSFWSAQEQSLSPACIVIPTTTQDVSIAVAILSVGHQASISRCKFAVRGAGHTPQAGAANIDGGVTIDMQSMNQVAVSSDQKIVSIGSGNRWGNVYPTLDRQNLAMIGGRVSPVGAGGLITGGGISYFSGRYGFACDNIQAFEIVLANGTVAVASSTTNRDLFRALKGGSNNFGIVTRFDAKLYPQTPFWGGSISQPITNKDAIFEFFTNFTVSANYDPYSALLTDFAWLAGIPTIVHQPIYTNGNATWPPPAFEALDSMPKLTSTMRKDRLASFTDELAATSAVTNGRNNLFLTTTFANRVDVTADFMGEVFELADAAAKELITVVGLVFTMTFQPLPYAVYSKSASTGGNVLGLDRFRDDLINLLFTISWQLPLDNARVEARLKALETDINNLARSKGILNEFIYLNYASAWQDPIRAYGDANVGFLRGVSRKYDPNGLFQRAVPGGFKLGI